MSYASAIALIGTPKNSGMNILELHRNHFCKGIYHVICMYTLCILTLLYYEHKFEFRTHATEITHQWKGRCRDRGHKERKRAVLICESMSTVHKVDDVTF